MKLIDSSVWLSHIGQTRQDASKIIESNIGLSTSILTLFEVRRRLIQLKMNIEVIEAALDLIKIRSAIINLSEEIVYNAVDLSIKNKLHSMDSLIYASALSLNIPLVTADNDFRGLDNVEIISK